MVDDFDLLHLDGCKADKLANIYISIIFEFWLGIIYMHLRGVE